MKSNFSLIFSLCVIGCCPSFSELPPRTGGLVTASVKEVLLSVSDTVPKSMRPLFSGSSYLERCRFVKDLSRNLTQAEIDALFVFITSSPEQVGLSRGQFNSVGDKVINKLEMLQPVPPALIDYLIAMFNDESGNFTWRDYCVQHLGGLYAREVAVGRQSDIMKVFDHAMTPETGMAGTALIALRKNIGEDGISETLIGNKAAHVAHDVDQSEASRMTAMLTAAELGDRDMLVMARETVCFEKSTHFRMSSMAVMGMLGDMSDLPVLNKYTESSDLRLRMASRSAVKKIESRKDTVAR